MPPIPALVAETFPTTVKLPGRMFTPLSLLLYIYFYIDRKAYESVTQLGVIPLEGKLYMVGVIVLFDIITEDVLVNI